MLLEVGCGIMAKDRCVSERNVLHFVFWNYSSVCFLAKYYLVFFVNDHISHFVYWAVTAR